MFGITPYMETCLESIPGSAGAVPTDAVLSARFKLQSIVDTYATALGLRNPGSRGDLSDPSTQLNLHNATKQLERWKRDNMPETVMTGTSPLLRFITGVELTATHRYATHTI